MDSKRKAFLKNVLVVLFSNVVSVASGVLIGFIIPKILGVSEYGYYKTFTLYCSYIGVLHFGFLDGIYLKFAGQKYEEIDKEKFRTYTRFLFCLEGIVSLFFLLTSLLFLNTTYFLILVFVSLNIFALNITTYFEYISQITMKFKRMTVRNVIKCSLNIVSVVALFLLFRFNGAVIHNSIYIVIVLFINYVMAFWYVLSYRDIVFGKGSGFRKEKSVIFGFFKIGIPLLLSNLVAQLVFVVDQQFVQITFDNDTYSIYAFAYNMISLITIATTAISIVLYPTLKTINEETIAKNYSKLNSYLLIFVAFCLISYYPLVLIVNHFLPNYTGSLNIFVIILPGVLISSSITVIKYNCYKTFNKIKIYFIKSMIVLTLAILADVLVYLMFKTVESISIVSIAVLFVWYILIESYFVKAFKVNWIKNLLYLVIVIGSFYGLTLIPNIYVSAISYFFVYAILTISFYFKEIKGLLKRSTKKEVPPSKESDILE